jgi:hypothetical protein
VLSNSCLYCSFFFFVHSVWPGTTADDDDDDAEMWDVFRLLSNDVHRVWRSIMEERLRSCWHQAGEITRFERYAVHDRAFLNTPRLL